MDLHQSLYMRVGTFLIILIGLGSLLAACGGLLGNATSTVSSTPTLAAATSAPLATTIPMVVRVGITFDNPPFETKDGAGKLVGFDVDLIGAIAKQGGFTIELQPTTWNDGKLVTEDLPGGAFDVVIAAITITPERQNSVDFSDPYFDAGQVIVVKQDSGITGPGDLNGKTIAIVGGTTGAGAVRAQIPGAIITSQADIAAALGQLESDRAQAVVYDSPMVLTYIKDHPSAKLAVIGSALTSEQYGIAVRKGQPNLLRMINAGLAKVKSSSTYNEFYQAAFESPPIAANPPLQTAIPTPQPEVPTSQPELPTAPLAIATSVPLTPAPSPSAVIGAGLTSLCVDGSDSVLGTTTATMTSAWIKALAERQIQLTIKASGTEAAVEHARQGECANVLIVSEPLNDGQVAALKQSNGLSDPTSFGRDIVVFVTDANTQMPSLSIPQITSILSGTITDWNQMGGAQQPVTILLRPGSGTTNYVLKQLLGWEPFVTVPGQPFPPGLHFTQCGVPGGNTACLKAVASTPGAFAWASRALAGAAGVRVLPIQDAIGQAIDPLSQSFDPNRYPNILFRPLYVYVLGRQDTNPAAAVAQTFVDYLRSPEGQQTLVTQGFYSQAP